MAVSTASDGLCKAPLNKSKHHNRVGESGSRISFAIAATSATSLVVSSAGFGAVFAWSTGLQHGLELAVLSVAFAVALEGIKPLAVAAAFQAFAALALVRGLAMTLLAVVAIAYSLTAELSLLAQTRGDAVAKREAVAKATTSADQQRQRLEAELASLGVVRPAGEIAAEIVGVMAANKLDTCDVWLTVRARTICATEIAPLKAELAKAERREALERDVSAVGTGTARTAGAAAAGAAARSTYLAALGLLVPVQALSQWLVLVSVFALEIGSALSVLLVRSVAGPTVRTGISCHTDLPAVTAPALSGHVVRTAAIANSQKRGKRVRGTTIGQRQRTAAQDAILNAIEQDGGRLVDGRVRTL